MSVHDEVSAFDESEIFLTLDIDKESDIAERWLQFAHTRIFGQPRYVDIVARALEQTRMRSGEPHQPFASILALGPSSVGKSLLPMVLSQFLFNVRTGLLKVACQDFTEPHAVSRLIGSPPGYVGHDIQPFFTQEALDKPAYRVKVSAFLSQLSKEGKGTYNTWNRRRAKINRELSSGNIDEKQKKSYLADLEVIRVGMQQLGCPEYCPDDETYLSIVLFDEIGKGNVALHNLMLSILREGELASARGDTTYFKNSFIFFTDNAGSEEIAERLRQKSGSGVRMGFDTTPAIGAPQQDDQEIYEIATRSLKKVFKIEFLNRINEIVVARPLSRDALLMLFGAERIKLRERFADQDCKITIEISDDVKDAMVDDALKKLEENASRLIKKFKSRIGDAIVRAYLTGQIKSGDRIKVTLKSGSTRKFLFQKIVEKKGKRKLAILSLSEPSG